MILALYGAGAMGREFKYVADETGQWPEAVFIDDHASVESLLDCPVVSFQTFRKRYRPENTRFVITIGEPKFRREAFDRMVEAGYQGARLIHPAAYISPDAEVGEGAVVEIDASRGWQNTGLTLDAGSAYKLTAVGRYDFYLASAGRALEFEPTGASLQYVHGAPIGRLEAVVVPEITEFTFDQVYGLGDGAPGARNPSGADGFRFDAFRGFPGGATRNRFGEQSDGFDRSDEKQDAQAAAPRKDRAPERSPGARPDAASGALAPLYNARYPWNGSVGFSSPTATLTPKTGGTLYMRINAPPGDVGRNRGTARVQIKRG